MSEKLSVLLESRCSSSVFFSIRPSGEIRSWVESPSTLDSGIIAILALLPLRRLHVYYTLCPLARPKYEPTRPRSWLIAVSRLKSTTRATASAPQKASSRPSDAMRSTDVLCVEDSLLCFDRSSTCASFTAMLDSDFVLSKAHAYKSNRKQQIRLSSSPSYLGPKYDGAEGKK